MQEKRTRELVGKVVSDKTDKTITNTMTTIIILTNKIIKLTVENSDLSNSVLCP